MSLPPPVFALDIRPGEPTLALAIVLLVLGYLVGSSPGSALVGRLAGIDPATQGERNPGSANVWKLAGPGPGIAALLLDLGRAVVPALLGMWAAGWWGAWVAGVGAIVGSMRPVLPGLRGGRGVAAGVGVALVLDPPAFTVALGIGALVYLAGRQRPWAIAAGVASYPVAFTVLSVRSPESLVALGAVGVLYLVLVAGFWLTRRRAGPG